MPTPVVIVPYDDGWPAEFDRVAARLAAALGPAALRIDHVGSTAVPGLPAKDVIDVQVTVARLGDVARPPAGFAATPIHADHAPPGIAVPPGGLAKLLFTPLPPGRPANVHVRVDGAFNQRYALLCRDYLRATPAAAAAYAELKRRLAAALGDDRDTYADVKDPVFDVLLAGAEAWAAATGWRPAAAG